jgi:tetratricopeptide (TPR) repeat protein
MIMRRVVVLTICFGLVAASRGQSQSWHLPGWSTRAVIEIPHPSTEPGVDTAGVKILCQGRGKADGSDYRVIDSSGKAVPFQLMFHDGPRYSLISFRVTDPSQRFFIYHGNPQAQRAAEQIVLDPRPGAGPPQADWVPRYGLVYATIERPEGPNPKTVPEIAALIAGSRAKHGARYQRKISDGYNPFGSSDYYISIYRGWLQIPKAGKYQFCTISNEASFSFLDGKELVHWPGRHTVERGIHGEKNASVELTAGLHYIEYYHEEVTLEQMAFLGWRPSADPGPFSAIPESVYTAPYPAVVSRYENAQGPLAHFEPVILDTIWPVERHEGQYTRCRFRPNSGAPLSAATTCRWDFGDGQTASGAEVEHVYLALGQYQVTLETTGTSGAVSARWPLDIYEMQHVTDEIKEGKLADYARLARSYDRNRLDAGSLKELAHLLAEAGEPAEAIQAGELFIKRFSDARPEPTARVRRLLADCSLRLGSGNLEQAIANYQASITKQTPLAEKLDIYARLIRLLGIERNEPRKADEILALAEAARKSGRVDAEAHAAYRRVTIAAGDVRLWHAKPDEARDFYQRAEVLTGQFIPPSVRAARIGAFPNSIREFIAAGNPGAALDVVNRWEETFPSEKIHGHTFFWRGKLLVLRAEPKEAARYLARAIGLAPGADFESEARWLLAGCLEKLGRAEEARKELAKLVASGINDPFTKLAREQLANKSAEGAKR